MLLKISLCLLALVVSQVSSDEYSGLLSRLYKKASNEQRPLILVLDSSSKNHDDTPRAVQTREVDADRNVPSSLLDLLNQKRQPIKVGHKHSLYEHPHHEHHDDHKIKHSDLHRLKYRLEKEQRDRRERRERNRAQDRDGDRNRDRDDEGYQYKEQDRNQDRKRDRYQYKKERDDDSERYSSPINSEKQVLRTSVIKNLLRTYNDLNCDAKEECADECGDKFDGQKKNTCENKCETKFDCAESEKEDACENDDCGSEEAGSTKGERLVTDKPTCKRC